MKKLWKLIPVLVIGLIAAFGVAGCAETGDERAERAATAKPVAAAVRTAAVYAAEDGTCEHDYEAAQTFAATCTEQGYTLYACSQCGQSYTDDFTPAKGHMMREIVVEPTCTHQGYTTHFCTVCGYEYSDAYKEARGHKYVSEKIDPTCTQAGYALHACSACGDSDRDDYREALGHA